jgi:phosphohistidine phosphatase
MQEFSMLRLMLLRHAKSSWGDVGVCDIDRPLNDRGRRAAAAMAERFFADDMVPQRVMCSPARRTRETWDIMAPAIKPQSTVSFEESLYDFGDGSQLLELIRNSDTTAKTLMLIGHNPSLEGLARSLVKAGDEVLRRRMALKFPTSALAVIDFAETTWEALSPNSGELISFVRPKDLVGDKA